MNAAGDASVCDVTETAATARCRLSYSVNCPTGLLNDDRPDAPHLMLGRIDLQSLTDQRRGPHRQSSATGVPQNKANQLGVVLRRVSKRTQRRVWEKAASLR